MKNLAETTLQMCQKIQSNVEKENLSHENEDAIDVTQKESRKDNIATLPRPDKEEAVSRHLSHFPHKGSTDKAPFKFQASVYVYKFAVDNIYLNSIFISKVFNVQSSTHADSFSV